MSFIASRLHVWGGAQPEPHGGVTRRRFRLLLQVFCLSVVISATIGAVTASMHGALLFRLALGALSGAITAAPWLC